jgi:hypothetical protein
VRYVHIQHFGGNKIVGFQNKLYSCSECAGVAVLPTYECWVWKQSTEAEFGDNSIKHPLG